MKHFPLYVIRLTIQQQALLLQPVVAKIGLNCWYDLLCYAAHIMSNVSKPLVVPPKTNMTTAKAFHEAQWESVLCLAHIGLYGLA